MKKACTVRVAKTKALISFAVTAKLVCAIVFVHADCWFSHAATHFTTVLPSLIAHLLIERKTLDGSNLK